ncbi:hypothetical protein [Frateuria sp.]|uniref:hypothetical protein n=1 Tax=Frateuria sp. TaxID=2211372 RepID=UPI003F7F59EE
MSEKFVELTRTDKTYDRENAWLSHCRSKLLPFITVRSRGSLAMVQWDYISYPPSIDSELFSLAPHIHDAANQIYEPHCTKQSRISLGPGVVTFYNLQVTIAREAAALLYDAIQNVTAPILLHHGKAA